MQSFWLRHAPVYGVVGRAKLRLVADYIPYKSCGRSYRTNPQGFLLNKVGNAYQKGISESMSSKYPFFPPVVCTGFLSAWYSGLATIIFLIPSDSPSNTA